MSSTTGAGPAITIFTSNPRGIYSGGRYLALILAHSLARAGASVTYVTDNLPMFDTDFAPFEAAFPVEKVVHPQFEAPARRTEWVIVIPTGSGNEAFYAAARNYAGGTGARVCLLSFETPNWFNALAPEPRSELPWDSWKRVVDRGGLVTTIAAAGIEPARAFYAANDVPVSYAFWHPPINDIAADEAFALAPRDGVERLTMFVRTEDRHKGAADLLALRPEIYAGRTLALVFGRHIDPDYLARLRRVVGQAPDARIEIYNRISDRAKFWLLARSRLLLFPSHFEGFGYPPVEAAYMGVGCVAYDLPVVRETMGEAARYVPVGDTEAFSDAVLAALAAPAIDARALLRIDPRTLTQGDRMLGLLMRSRDSVLPYSVRAPVAPPALRVRAATLRLPEIDAEWSAATSPVTIARLVARIEPDGMVLAGTLHGVQRGDRLVIAYDNEALTTIRLDPATGDTTTFDVRKRLPPLAGEPLPATFTVLRANKRIARLNLPLSIAPFALLDANVWHRALRPVPAGDRTGAVTMVLDVARLFGETRYAMAAAEIAAAVRAAGGRTRLLGVGDTPVRIGVDPDCLPLFDEIVPIDRRALRAHIERLDDGTVTVADRAVVPDGPPGAELTIDDATVWTASGGRDGHGAPVRYRPDDGNALRSVIAARNTRVLVVGGAASAATAERLERFVEGAMGVAVAQLGGVAAFVHRPLVRASRVVLPLDIGVSGTLAAAGLPQIRAAIEAAGTALIYDLSADGAPDPALEAVAADTAATLVACGGALPEPETIVAAFERAARVRLAGPFAAAVTGRLSPAADAATLASLTAGLAVARETGNAEPAARYRIGEAIAFRAAGSTLDRYAVTGWGKRNEQGTEISGAAGLLAFAMPADEAGEPTTLAVHLHLRKPLEGAEVTLRLNGVRLAGIALPKAGLHMLSAEIPPQAWNASGLQALSIGRHATEGLPEIVVGALAVERRVTAQSWAESEPATGRAAPIDYPAGPFDPRGWVLTGEGETIPMLATGWGIEPGYSWSTAPLSIIDFSADPLRSEGPLIATLEASALVGAVQPEQRFELQADGEPIGTLALGNHEPESVVIPIPPQSVRNGLSALMIASIDRISPLALGLNQDGRRLGMRVVRLDVAAADTVAATARLDADAVAELADVPAGSLVVRVAGQGGWEGRIVSIDGAPFAATAQAAAGGWEAWLALPADRAPRLVLRVADETGADERGAVDVACYARRGDGAGTIALARIALGQPDTPPTAEEPAPAATAADGLEPEEHLHEDAGATDADADAPVEAEPLPVREEPVAAETADTKPEIA